MAKVIETCWGYQIKNDNFKPFECKECYNTHEVVDAFNDDDVIRAIEFMWGNPYGLTWSMLLEHRIDEGKPYSNDEIELIKWHLRTSLKIQLELLDGFKKE